MGATRHRDGKGLNSYEPSTVKERFPSPLSDATPIGIEELRDRLPEGFKDSVSNKVHLLSQSKIKHWIEVLLKQRCPKRFLETTFERRCREKTSKEQLMGQRFEYQLTGNRNYDGLIPEPLLTSALNPSPEQKLIDKNVILAKKVFEENGWDLDHYKSAHLVCKGLEGHTDLMKVYDDKEKVHIMDIKYSGLLGEKTMYNKFAFHKETIGSNFNHICQGATYTLLGHLLYPGYKIEFTFAVFDSRKDHVGNHRIFHMQFKPETLCRMANLILKTCREIEAMYQMNRFTTVPDYEQCQKCAFTICPSKATKPTPIIIEV